MNVFIYTLNCPITGDVRYVGKSADPKSRFKKHFREAKKEKHRRANWIRSLQLLGLEPHMQIVQEISELGWGPAECEWIQTFKYLGFDLVNSTEGGENPPSCLGKKLIFTEAHRKNISLSAVGRRQTKETCLKRSLAMRGRKYSKDHRDKIGLAHRGRVYSKETLLKMSIAQKKRFSKSPVI